MSAWCTCADCGYPAMSALDFSMHLDVHDEVTRDPSWYIASTSRSYAQWDDATAPVVFIHEKTGQVRYPGQNSAKLPAGYRREHLRSLQDVNRFERAHGVANEAMHFDSNGRGLDDTIFGKSATH